MATVSAERRNAQIVLAQIALGGRLIFGNEKQIRALRVLAKCVCCDETECDCYTCPECDGDCVIECGACSGSGGCCEHATCDACDGKGQVTCIGCVGIGLVRSDRP
jgi:hypothetical protein